MRKIVSSKHPLITFPFSFESLKFYFLLFCLASFFGCSSSSSDYSAAITEGRTAANEIMTETGATAVSIALVDGDRVIWSEAFGDADKGTAQKATTSTLFGTCSVSKMLATTAAMILVDRRSISLDQPVKNYIGSFSMPLDARYQNITVRMLLDHSSGLPGNDSRGALSDTPFPGYAAQMMDGLKYQRLKNDPGNISSYNNDGFTMIANLVKAVTGQEYPDFVRENILTPLKMTTSLYMTTALPAGSYAKSYNGNTLISLPYLNVYSTGGLFSTPTELSHLAMMIINNGMYGSRRILSEASITAMAQDQRIGQYNPVPFEENRFGLGWDTVAQPGMAAVSVLTWQKGGDMNGFYGASFAVAPEEKLGVIVFGASNAFSSDSAVKVSERILLRALVARGRIAGMPAQLSTADLPLKAVTVAEKSVFTGYYGSGTTAYRLSYGAGDALMVDEYQTDWTPKYSNFKLRTDGWYAADGDPVKALQLFTSSGRNYIALRMKRGNGHYSINTMFAQMLDTKPALSLTWQARTAEKWLPVNCNSWQYSMGDPRFALKAITGLTGYLMGNKISRDMAVPTDDRLDGMFFILPDGLRDLEDVGMEAWNAQSWLRHGSTLCRPLSGVSALAAGASAIVIGSDGFAEWRSLPSSGTIILSGTDNWFLYNDSFELIASGTTSGTTLFSGAGAKYLVLLGVGGSTINLNLTP